MPHYDVIVAGGGTMGTAAAWELARRGVRAHVLEQFEHVHPYGAHSGDTRIIRHAYAEGADYVPLVMRADELWTELESATRDRILHRVGAIELSAPGFDRVTAAQASAAEHSVSFELLPIAEVRRRFPRIAVDDDWRAGFEPGGGFLDVEPALRGMAKAARAGGVDIREHSPVASWSVEDGVAHVRTGDEIFTADRLIIAGGAWTHRLLAELALPITIVRKTLFWLEVHNPADFAPERMPVYIAEFPGANFYGFPGWGRPGIKVALHNGGLETDPDRVDRVIPAPERGEAVRAARAVLGGITGRVLDETTCLYANTPDEDFLIDRHPDHPNVVFAAGFSGHGFKFAPAIGELIVQMAFGERETLPRFRLDRF